MEHDHHHIHFKKTGKLFLIGIIINIIYIIIEVVFGLLSNSMALISDAGHNFSDVITLFFSWGAIRLSQRKPTSRFTYGFRRSTILAAILNTLLLFAAVTILAFETIKRIGNPVEINSLNVILIAFTGIIINGFTAWLFVKGQKHDLNIRSAFIHFIADTLVSLGVVFSGIIMFFTGIVWIDSLASILIILIIIYGSYRLLIDSVSLAMDAVPEYIDIKAVRKYLENIPEVSGIHDLHIWALGTSTAAMTVHLETNRETDVNFITTIQNDLREKYKIAHSTIQVETGGRPENCNDCIQGDTIF
ncbi:MAG: cation transporter [Bacteroidetes bacterium]|jgi:cobalt-zinc-cadmium efflux system protein|nr:cation transporter [Bacteroidota bacterium]